MVDAITMVHKIHPFEGAGLGVAPFRCVGHSVEKFQAAPGDPSCPMQPGAACDYCGTGIMDVFHIQSSDGRRFKVGCDCVRRTYFEFDAEIPPDFRREIARLQAEKREAKRQVAHERLMVRVAKAKAELAKDADLFSAEPHPHEYHAKNGLRRRDYFAWVLQHGGATGRADVCRAIETATADYAPAVSVPPLPRSAQE